MDEAILKHLEKIISEIDTLVPKAGSLVLIRQEHKFPSHAITGNRSGLLRSGIELLRAALLLRNNQSSWNPFETETVIDTGCLKADVSGIWFSSQDSLQKREYKKNGERVLTRKEGFQQIIFIRIFHIIFSGFFALAIIGLITIGCSKRSLPCWIE